MQGPSERVEDIVHNTVLIRKLSENLGIMSDTLEMVVGTVLPSVTFQLSLSVPREQEEQGHKCPMSVQDHTCLLQSKENEGEKWGNIAKCR